jgi:hypothetical protein
VQDYHAAAERHCADAAFLANSSRWPNADHLAGFAAECALKEMLISFLGAQKTTGKPFSIVGGARRDHGHLPALWGEAVALLAGRQTPATTLLLATSPFGTWSVHDRYEDGAGVAQGAAAARVQMARQLVAHLAAAKLQGGLS